MNDDQNIFDFEETDVRQRSPHLIPWIVTGAIAVIAILVSLIVMNIAKGDSDPGETTKPPVVETPEVEPEPEPEPEPAPEPEPESQPEVTDPNRPDDAIDTSGVTVGGTFSVDVTQDGWEISTEVSNKLGNWRYMLENNRQYMVLKDSGLINSLPAECEAQRDKWGLELLEDGSFAAYSPQEMCEQNESLYIELLGIVRHMEETVKPL